MWPQGAGRSATTSSTSGRADERDLVDRLRAGDEQAFTVLVDRHHASMVRFARGYVRSASIAEEAAQDAWVGLLRGIDRFDGRSSLRTWLFSIVARRAISAGQREVVHIPVDGAQLDDHDGRFTGSGWWAQPPVPWSESVEDRLDAIDVAARIRALIDELPTQQRQVVTLRDVDGLTSVEVCDIMRITAGHQRVLLHRARARIRARLETEAVR